MTSNLTSSPYTTLQIASCTSSSLGHVASNKRSLAPLVLPKTWETWTPLYGDERLGRPMGINLSVPKPTESFGYWRGMRERSTTRIGNHDKLLRLLLTGFIYRMAGILQCVEISAPQQTIQTTCVNKMQQLQCWLNRANSRLHLTQLHSSITEP